jgi:hypothetical protein
MPMLSLCVLNLAGSAVEPAWAGVMTDAAAVAASAAMTKLVFIF